MLTVPQLADLVGATRQAAHAAASKGLTGERTWRGITFRTVPVRGKGGRSGQTFAIEILSQPATALAIPSAPPALPVLRVHTVAPTPDRHIDDPEARELAAFKERVAKIVCRAPKGPAREAAIRVACEHSVWPSGKKKGQPVKASTVAVWVEKVESGRPHELLRKRRDDDKVKRVTISEAWDELADAADVPAAERQRIWTEAETFVVSVFGHPGHVRIPATKVRKLLRQELIAWSAAAGMSDGPKVKLRKACLLPLTTIRKLRGNYPLIGIKARDAETWHASYQGHIDRDRSHLPPRQYLAADVFHIDWACRLPGSDEVVTPKLILYLDLATNEIVHYSLIFPPSGAVTRNDVLRSWIELCATQGTPLCLYVDNGSEFRIGDVVNDMMILATQAQNLNLLIKSTEDLAVELPGVDPAGWKPGVRNALPGRPKSKVVEFVYSVLARGWLRTAPWWIGGDRQRKVSDRKGRMPTKVCTDEGEARGHFDAIVKLYNSDEQDDSKLLKGQAPWERLAQYKADHPEWGIAPLDRESADVAAAIRHDGVMLRHGGRFAFQGREFICDDPGALPFVGRRVSIRQSLFDADRLYLFDGENKEALGQAAPADLRTVRFDDVEGAIKAGAVHKRDNDAVRAMRKRTVKVDLPAKVAAAAAALPPPPDLPIVANISAGPAFDAGALASRRATADSEEEDLANLPEVRRFMAARG